MIKPPICAVLGHVWSCRITDYRCIHCGAIKKITDRIDADDV